MTEDNPLTPDEMYLEGEDIDGDTIFKAALKDLIPDADNARVHTDFDLNVLGNNIKTFHFHKSDAVKIDEDGNILCGNGRYMVAKKLGMEHVWAEVLYGLSDEEKALKKLADNRVSDLSFFDQDILMEQLAPLEDAGFDLVDFGFEMPDMDQVGIEDAEDMLREEDLTVGEQSVQEENYTVMVFCKDEDELTLLSAFLDKNGMTGKRCE